MGKTADKLGQIWGMRQITQIARAVFFVFALVVIPSVFPYLRLHKAAGRKECTLKMAPHWIVFPIFPKKSLIYSEANAPINLV